MSKYASLQDDLIAALATPFGESALAVIRTSGKGCIEAIAGCFSRPQALLEAGGNSILHGWLNQNGHPVDEVTLGVFRSPRSYTGEDSVEIYCHGSIPGIEKIMSLLFRTGFRQAEPGEFSLRAFLNGKMDLTRAEAVHELVKTRTQRSQSLALNRLAGRVFDEIDRVKQLLVDIMAAVSVQLDYPEDELPDDDDDTARLARLIPVKKLDEARHALTRLGSSYRTGRLYQEGARVALAGRTNAGKSSMFNLFLKEDRSIVSEVHGTTRDYIEAPVVLAGIPLRLFDTAGLRDVDEIIEKEGIRRSGQIIENSSIILYLVDGSNPEQKGRSFDSSQLARIAELSLPCVKIWTKIDLPECGPAPEGFFPLSVMNGEGFGAIQDEMYRLLSGGLQQPDESDVVIDSLRQKHLIEDAAASLERVIESLEAGYPLDVIALDLQQALYALGEITGEVTAEDVLDRVFSGFCVGK